MTESSFKKIKIQYLFENKHKSTFANTDNKVKKLVTVFAG
jgi:hypothetical protein